jgi:coenzyme F420-reducing hydrogenase gamma subunit
MTTQVYQRLETAKDGAESALNRTDVLLAQFKRSLHARVNAEIRNLLRGRVCLGCEPSYCAASAAAFVLERDGVWVEPQPCQRCDGFRLVPSSGVSHG